MIKDVVPLLKECEEALADLKIIGDMGAACYVQGFINSINALPEVERGHGEWIPCSERLPDKSGEYFTTCKIKNEKYIGIRFFNEDGFAGASLVTVLAWMSLPEPYKEEGEAE